MNVVDKGDTAEALNSAVEAAETGLKNISAGLIKEGIKAEYHVLVGESADEINKTAEEQDVSLIAMGSRGKGILEELMLGSTVERTVRNSRRPVLGLRT